MPLPALGFVDLRARGTYHQVMSQRLRFGWIVAFLVGVAAVGASTGCRRKLAEGTCRNDNDCKPAWNCKEGVCVEREKPPWEQAQPAAPTVTKAKPGSATPGNAPWPDSPAQPQPNRAPVFVPLDQKVVPPIPPAPGEPYRPQPVRRGPRYFPLDT